MSEEDKLPVVSFKNIQNPDNFKIICKNVEEAISEYGFFIVIDHSITKETIEQAFSHSKKFFSSSKEEKENSVWTDSASNRGYIKMNKESLDPTSGRSDPKESYNVGSVNDGKNIFPDEKFPEFGEFYEDFYLQCYKLSLQIMKIFAINLKLDEDFFDKSHSEMFNTLRILHYPKSDEKVKAGIHSDYGSITLLFQDDIGGLEILKKGKWIPVRNPNVSEETFPIIINSGDLMEIWTNKKYPSVKHRVIGTKRNEIESRYSIAYFCHPDKKCEIKTIFRK
eukprot:gene9361-1572_t